MRYLALALNLFLLISFNQSKTNEISSPIITTSTTDIPVNLDTLQLVQVFFRHGDRSPLFDFPRNPVNISETWPTGMGQLTPKGMEQAHELGQYLRKRYSTFMRETYHPKDIYAVSSDIDRSIMSGQCVLAGLYPQKGEKWNPYVNWDPLPIRTIPLTHDSKIAFSAPCPNYWSEMHKYKTEGDGKKFDEQYKEYYDFIACNTGLTNITFVTVGSLFDTLFIQHSNGFQLPEWSSKPHPKGKPFLMRQIAEMTFACLTYSEKAMLLRGGPIFREIVRNMDVHALKSISQYDFCKAKKATTSKMILYSGHDTTLSTIMQALGVYENYLIPYSSAIIVELHKDYSNNCGKSSQELFFVKVFYRNCSTKPPIELKIPDCNGDQTLNGKSGICTLERLRKIKAHFFSGKWGEECGGGSGCNNGKNCNLFEHWIHLYRHLVIYPFEGIYSMIAAVGCKMHSLVPCNNCQFRK